MPRVKAVPALIAANLFFAVASAQSSGCIDGSDIACTEQGAIRGVVQGLLWRSRESLTPRRQLGRCGGSRLHQQNAGMACVTAAASEPCAHKSLETR